MGRLVSVPVILTNHPSSCHTRAHGKAYVGDSMFWLSLVSAADSWLYQAHLERVPATGLS